MQIRPRNAVLSLPSGQFMQPLTHIAKVFWMHDWQKRAIPRAHACRCTAALRKKCDAKFDVVDGFQSKNRMRTALGPSLIFHQSRHVERAKSRASEALTPTSDPALFLNGATSEPRCCYFWRFGIRHQHIYLPNSHWVSSLLSVLQSPHLSSTHHRSSLSEALTSTADVKDLPPVKAALILGSGLVVAVELEYCFEEEEGFLKESEGMSELDA